MNVTNLKTDSKPTKQNSFLCGTDHLFLKDAFRSIWSDKVAISGIRWQISLLKYCFCLKIQPENNLKILLLATEVAVWITACVGRNETKQMTENICDTFCFFTGCTSAALILFGLTTALMHYKRGRFISLLKIIHWSSLFGWDHRLNSLAFINKWLY